LRAQTANLSGASLIYADLWRANLKGANLTMAKLGETALTGITLANVIGLETCIHRGPSMTDYRTLQKSGPLPVQFLRGVGLPERLIDYLPSLLDQAIERYSCFISYSTMDQDFAERLHTDLQDRGCGAGLRPMTCRSGAEFSTRSMPRSGYAIAVGRVPAFDQEQLGRR
jgi:uncharacterized protein YjbI with pentapeptide repeats